MCNFMCTGVAIAVATTYYHEPKSCQLSSPSACLIVCAVRLDYCCLLVGNLTGLLRCAAERM